MAEDREANGSIRWVIAVPTVVSLAAMVGIAYWCDKIYRRWLRENHPLAGYRARLARLKTGYQGKRASMTEAAQVISDVLVEVARAASTGSAR